MQESGNDNSINKIILADALSKLNETFRIPLLMSKYENYSYEEISKKLLSIIKKMGVSLWDNMNIMKCL